MLLHPFSMRRARFLYAGFVIALLLTGFWFYRGSLASFSHRVGWAPSRSPSGPLPLPPEYVARAEDSQEPEFCRDRFGTKFLHDLRNHSIGYCAPGSPSALTCFHTRNHPDGKVDSLCIGQNATLNPDTGKFQLGCQVRTPDANETAAGLIPLDQLGSYWYDTGPGVIFNRYVDVTTKTTTTTPGAGDAQADNAAAGDGGPPPRYALLLKREGEGNLWHCLMEIMTMTLTMDVLRMARAGRDPTGPALFAAPDSVPDTQVVLLDDKPDGPYFALWKLFAGRDPVRLRDVLGDPATARAWAATPQAVVVPLPGAANPLWQNDWTERECRAAPLLRVFARRVLAHYGVGDDDGSATDAGEHPGGTTPDEAGEGGDRRRRRRRLRLTLIDRAGTRRLADGAALLQAARARFPDVAVAAVDFAALDFAAQLRTARATDVLIGVHGAGLTHALFLRPGAAVVEIEPPRLDYHGFRNLARMRGLHYFQARAATVARRDWHDEDVRLPEHDFLDVVADAIAALRAPPGLPTGP